MQQGLRNGRVMRFNSSHALDFQVYDLGVGSFIPEAISRKFPLAPLSRN